MTTNDSLSQDRAGPLAAEQENVDRVQRFYDSRGREQDRARQVSWRAIWDQEFRFEVLCEIFDRHPAQPFSVLDVGCGLGDLAAYLRRRGDPCQYLGVDILPGMVEEARRRFPGERFEVVDILHADPPPGPFDYVLASGALSVKIDQHEQFVRRMVARMLALCTKGLAFNMQSARARTRNVTAQLETEIYYADPLELYQYCRTLTPRTILREDFVTTDFAIFLFPGPTPAHRGYGRFLGLDPVREDRAVGLAYLYLEQKMPREALAVLADAPESPEVCNYQGLCHLYLNQPGEALEPLRRSWALDPGQFNAPVNLGAALSLLGRTTEAMDVWREALDRCPENQSARMKLVHALLQAGQGIEAEVHAVSLQDEELRDDLLGLAMAQQGRLEEARQLLERVAERNPSMSKVRSELAALLERMGDEPAAARRWLETLRLNPEHQEARQALRRLALRNRGRGRTSASRLREVIASFSTGAPELTASLLRELDRPT